MANPEYQQAFSNIIGSIKEGTYKAQNLDLSRKGLTNEDATELCEAMRVVSEADKCNITQLSLANNKLTAFNGKGLAQLKNLDLSCNQLTILENIEELTQLKRLNLSLNYLPIIENIEELIQLKSLYLSYNQLTTLTRVKLFGLFPADLLDTPNSDVSITQPTKDEQAKVNEEFNEKVDWATLKLLELLAEEPGAIKSIKSQLQSQLQSQLEEAEGLLLKSEDSVYIINEASIQVDQKIAEKRSILQNNLFLSCPPIPEHIKEKIIAYTCLFEHKDEIKNDDPSLIFSQGHRQENVMQTFPDSNAFAASSMEEPISPHSPKP